jgi:hemerythrin-like metal-binding protein
MSLLEWKPEYSVGIASMDDEHREMIDLINAVYAKLGTSSDPDEIEDCLENIFSTISLHFALEERIMREQSYAEYPEHKEDHEDCGSGIGRPFARKATVGLVCPALRLIRCTPAR